MRLQKYLSSCGVCSRREAEKRIENGRITVNGSIAQLGQAIDPEKDIIALDGITVKYEERPEYIMLHKPAGYVTTMKDEKGRQTVCDLIQDAELRLYPVGRLDMMSEGLLLFTNDGEVANHLMHPSFEVKKTYRVYAIGEDAADKVHAMESPVVYNEIHYSGGPVQIIKLGRGKIVFDITIHEGKNREVRNMCAAVGLKVVRLIRISFGSLALGDLPSGKWRYLSDSEIDSIRCK